MQRTILFFTTLLLAVNAWCANDVEVEVLAKTSTSWNGAPLPEWQAGKPEITLLRIRVAPNTRLGMHKHPMINAGVLISGTLRVTTLDGQVLELQAGDPIVEVVETWHYGENAGTEEAEIIVFYAGTEGQQLSIARD